MCNHPALSLKEALVVLGRRNREGLGAMKAMALCDPACIKTQGRQGEDVTAIEGEQPMDRSHESDLLVCLTRPRVAHEFWDGQGGNCCLEGRLGRLQEVWSCHHCVDPEDFLSAIVDALELVDLNGLAEGQA